MIAASVLLPNVPIPPTSNKQYLPVYRRGKASFASSKCLTEYKALIKRYYLENILLVQHARKIVKDLVTKPGLLSIETCFYFKKEKLYTQKNKPQVMDVSNRLKALHDCVAELLDIDDCYFFSLYAEKRIVSDDQQEYVDVTIKPYNGIRLF